MQSFVEEEKQLQERGSNSCGFGSEEFKISGQKEQKRVILKYLWLFREEELEVEMNFLFLSSLKQI